MGVHEHVIFIRKSEIFNLFSKALIYRKLESYSGYSEGYCSTLHDTQYLGLECPAVALSLTSILSSQGVFLVTTANAILPFDRDYCVNTYS